MFSCIVQVGNWLKPDLESPPGDLSEEGMQHSVQYVCSYIPVTELLCGQSSGKGADAGTVRRLAIQLLEASSHQGFVYACTNPSKGVSVPFGTRVGCLLWVIRDVVSTKTGERVGEICPIL